MKRVQLSVLFDDEKVVEGLVEPYKKGRLLNALIVKLLTLYYYNDEFRIFADSASTVSIVSKEQEIIDKTRAELQEKFIEIENVKEVDCINVEDIYKHKEGVLIKDIRGILNKHRIDVEDFSKILRVSEDILTQLKELSVQMVADSLF